MQHLCLIQLSSSMLKALKSDIFVKQIFNKILISSLTRFNVILIQKLSFYSIVKSWRRNVPGIWNPPVYYKEYKRRKKPGTFRMNNCTEEGPSQLMTLTADDFPSDDDCDMDILLAEHLNKIDEITRSYKNTISYQFNIFKRKLDQLRGSDPPQRLSATLVKTKRKPSEESNENASKLIKLGRELSTDNDGFVHVFTDGACSNNGKINPKAGLGVWFGENHPLNVGEPVKGRATNNVGEIQACTRAIEIARAAGVQKLCINTDSQFVINSMTTWIHNWKKKNWKLKDGGPVKNKYDFIDLDNASRTIEEIKWNYVKGHVGIDGNEGADALARKGAAKYRL